MLLLCQARFGNIAANNPTRDRPRSNRVREPSLLECSATTSAAYRQEMGTQLVFHSNTVLTLPTKVPSDSLGRIGGLRRISDKSLFLMALGSYGHRITHQLRPINVNGRSILSVTSALGPSDRTCFNARSTAKQKSQVRDPNALDFGLSFARESTKHNALAKGMNHCKPIAQRAFRHSPSIVSYAGNRRRRETNLRPF